MKRPFVLLLIVFLPAGCGGGESGGQASALSTRQAARVALGELGKISCARTLECCSPHDRRALTDYKGPDQASCEAVIVGIFQTFYGIYDASIEAGKVVYRPDKMAECQQKLRTRTCAEIRTFLSTPECYQYFAPAVTLGSACQRDFECIGGYCARNGVCTARKCNGLACNLPKECASSACDEKLDQCGPAEPFDLLGFGACQAVGNEPKPDPTQCAS